MQKQILTPESYVFRFGKYKNMKAIDVADIYEVDKNGEDKPKGLQYLQWIVQQEWFKHTNIIEQIIKSSIDCNSADDEKEQEKPAQEAVQPDIKPKKEKKDKKEKKPKDVVETVLNFD